MNHEFIISNDNVELNVNDLSQTCQNYADKKGGNEMKERFDFSSISKVILANIKHDEYNKEYFYTLFAYAFSFEEIKITDESNISRIINGERRVPKEIRKLYQSALNFDYLKEDVSAVLEEVFDVPKLKEQIHKMLMEDMTLSKQLKEELSGYTNDDLLFLTKCILISFDRKFIKRRKEGDRHVLEKKLDLSDFLLDYHYPKSNKQFFGRDMELNTIHEQLNTENYLFLQGIGGIGKTELALHYGKKFEDEYSNILYLRYTESMYQTICKFDFIDDTLDMSEEQLFDMHYRFFKKLDSNTLVILDNFNLLLEEDELLQDFLSLSFQLLVTTRSNVREYVSYEVKEIESIEDLKNLFYAYAPAGKNSPDVVHNIIEEVYRHTLTVEIAAKTLSATGLTTEELLESLKEDRLNLSNPNKIRIQKDTRIKKATPKEHLTRLFQLQDLPEEYLTLLQHIRLMPDSGIPKRLFCKWMQTTDFNIINDLISYGWIQEDEETNRISIHPFLNEVLEITDHPSFLKCQQFIENVGNEYIANVEDEIFYRDLLNLTKSIFKKIEIDDTGSAFCLLEKILIYLEKYVYYNTMKYMLKLYKEIIPMGAENKKETATYKFYKGVIAWGEFEVETGAKYFQEGISILKPFDKSNVELAISLYHRLFFYHILHGEQKQVQQCAQTVIELRKLYNFTDSIDCEYDNVMLALVNPENYQMELEKLIELPQLKSFIQNAKNSGTLNFTKKEFLKNIEKIEPNEFNEDMGAFYSGIKWELEKGALAMQDEISPMDIFATILDITEKYSKNS